MLTPLFSCSQSDDFVLLTIKTPYVKATNIEFFIDACEFKLHVHPYFLRLTFPHPVVENGKESARFDVGKGEMFISLPKKDAGLFFPDLDLLSKLMMPKKSSLVVDSANKGASVGKPLIEEMDSAAAAENEDEDQEEEEEDADDQDFDWEIPQELPEPYGFNNSYSGFASHVAELGREIIDIDAIDQSTPASRRAERIEKEDEKFDEDYYMSDFMNDDEIKYFCKFKPKFWASLKKIQQLRSNADGAEDDWLAFTPTEHQEMISLPNRKLLLESTNTKQIYLGLLSATLSTFETFTTLSETLVASTRRALAYPLYRHMQLIAKVKDDVSILFKLGKRALLKCLLSVRRLMRGDDACFIFDRLYLEDYCLWIQSDWAKEKVIQDLGSEIHHYRIENKSLDVVGWDLEALEALAKEIGNGEDDDDEEMAEG
ncbi:SHQ1 protein-domain-containing protein [Obelidium mucronatum]|nr:SHQ1 protein-domain-containing protein [Obelidium mucronatum]